MKPAARRASGRAGSLTTPVVVSTCRPCSSSGAPCWRWWHRPLSASGLPPACLELELTESILLQDVESTIRTL